MKLTTWTPLLIVSLIHLATSSWNRETLTHDGVYMLEPIIEQSQDASCSVVHSCGFTLLSRCLNMCLMSIPGICSSPCVPSLKTVLYHCSLSKLVYFGTWQSAFWESWVHLSLSLTLFSGFLFFHWDMDISTATSAAPSQSLQLFSQAFMQRWRSRFFTQSGNSLLVESAVVLLNSQFIFSIPVHYTSDNALFSIYSSIFWITGHWVKISVDQLLWVVIFPLLSLSATCWQLQFISETPFFTLIGKGAHSCLCNNEHLVSGEDSWEVLKRNMRRQERGRAEMDPPSADNAEIGRTRGDKYWHSWRNKDISEFLKQCSHFDPQVVNIIAIPTSPPLANEDVCPM